MKDDDLDAPDDREVTPDRIIIFQNHPLFPIVHLLRDTEAKMVQARAEAVAWQENCVEIQENCVEIARELRLLKAKLQKKK